MSPTSNRPQTNRAGSSRRRASNAERTRGAAPHGGRPTSTTVKQREAAKRALAASAHVRDARRRRLITVLSPIAVVVVVVAAFVALRAGNNTTHSGKKSTSAQASVVAAVTGVPASAFDAVGAGSGTQDTPPTAITGAPLTADGKPRVLYIGAEYCPYCAAERWALIVALSRFGTWKGLSYTYSGAAPEVYPNTPTFTFHGATYTSTWLSFTGVETQTNQEKNGSWTPLDTLSAQDAAIMRQHDPQGSVPYTNLAGRYVINGSTYSPGILAGRSHAQIAAALNPPTSKIGTSIIAAANMLTAALCRSTNGQPSQVCSSSGVTAAAKALPRAG